MRFFTQKILWLFFICAIIHTSLEAQLVCTNKLANGEFADADPDQGWNEDICAFLAGSCPTYSTDPLITTDMPRNGSYSAKLGGFGDSPLFVGGIPYSYPFHTSITTIPPRPSVSLSATSAELVFWLNYDAAANQSGDVLQVYIDNTVGSENFVLLATYDSDDASLGNGTWQMHTIDITSYITGNLLDFKFETTENGPGTSTFFIDDIEVLECSGSCPTQISLPATISGVQDFETNGQIANFFNDVLVQSGATVDIDSGTDITLGFNGNTFEVQLGAEVCIFIDGCNGTGGIVNPATGGNTQNLILSDDGKKEKIEIKIEAPEAASEH